VVTASYAPKLADEILSLNEALDKLGQEDPKKAGSLPCCFRCSSTNASRRACLSPARARWSKRIPA
jgi:hypothetical protein